MLVCPEPQSIGRQCVENAIVLWRDYFWPHSRAALRQMVSTRRRSLERRVLVWLRKSEKTEVSIKDVRRELFGHMLNAKDCESLLDSLATSSWLKKQTETTGGRPLHRWLVNPILHLGGAGAESAGSAERVSALCALPAYEELKRVETSNASRNLSARSIVEPSNAEET